MRTTCPRGGVGVGLLGLVDGGDIGWRSDAQAFDMTALSTRSKSGSWDSQAIAKGVLGVVGHLSKTASVKTHDDF